MHIYCAKSYRKNEVLAHEDKEEYDRGAERMKLICNQNALCIDLDRWLRIFLSIVKNSVDM